MKEAWSKSERRKRAQQCDGNPKGFTMRQFCKNIETRSAPDERKNERDDSETDVLSEEFQVGESTELYHATQPTRLEGILGTGLTDRGPSKFGGNPGQRGISATTDFSVVSGGDFGNLVLVIDPHELRDYELVPTDYWGDGSEKEVRIIGLTSGPTIVPSSAIKRLIFITPRLPGFEARHIQRHGIPVATFWRGEMKQLTESRKAPKGGTALLREYIREMMEADFGEKVWAKRAPSGSRHQGEEPDTAIEGKLYTAIKWFLDKGNTQLWDEEAKLAFHQATMDPRYNDVFKYETSGKLYRGMRVSGPWAVEKASGVPDAVWMQNLHSQTNSKRTRGALKNVSEMIPTSKVYVPTARSNGFSSWTPDFEQAKKFASQVQDNQSITEMGIILVADASGGNFLDMSAIYDFEGLGNFRGEQERISVGDVQLEGAHFVQPSKPRNWI